MSHDAFCGRSREHRGELVTGLAPRWESGRRERRRSGRRRQADAGPKYALVFPRSAAGHPGPPAHRLTHQALGVTCQAGSFTTGRAIGEIQPLLAERGFAVPQRPGLRLRTLVGVFAYA